MHKIFPSQMDQEEILLVVREHWFLLLFKFIVWLMFLVALELFQYYGNISLPGLFTGDFGMVTNLFMEVYKIFLLLSLFLIWLFHYLNIQVITNVRVVESSQTGLFDHIVSELHIDKIEDVSSKTTGVFGTIFDYGTVTVQTAGTLEKFEFDNVPNPGQIEKIILDLYEKNSNFAKDGAEGK